MGIIAMLIVGLIAGLIARAVVPGNNSMGWIGTMVLGIVGSFVGGFLASLFHTEGAVADFHATGLIGSIIGSIILLVIVHMFSGRRAVV